MIFSLRSNLTSQLLVGTFLLSLFMVISFAARTDIHIPQHQAITHLSPDFTGSIDIGSNMLFLRDSDHQLTTQTLLNSQMNWATIDQPSPNFGFTTAAYWFNFNLHNEANESKDIIIELPIPFLDDVQLFQTQNGQVIHSYHLGDKYPFDQRPIRHTNFVMPLTLLPGDNPILMRLASTGTIEATLSIWSPDAFMLSSSDKHLIEGIWAGIIGIMVIYNLLLFFSIREVGYLHYSGFALGYLLFQLSLQGYAFAYLWPNSVEWNSHAIPTMIACCNFFNALLSISFLNLKENSPFWHKAMQIYAALCFVFFVLTFIAPYTIMVRITSLITLMLCIITPSISFKVWLSGYSYAKFFCLGWTSAFSGIGILALTKFGVLPSTVWTNNAGHAGMVIMMALLSRALAERFKREKELRLNAQGAALESETAARKSKEELLEIQESTNHELELKVRERTQTLQKAMMDLEQANNRLELLSTTDALTTLFNRGYFEARLEVEFKRALRHQREISIVLCDVDFFKNINDNFGHKTGDQCLRSFALTLKNKIIRSGDLIARFGGEEFIMMLVDTPLHDAEYIANSLCEEVRNIAITSDQQEIKVTASFGVASLAQSNADTAEDLIHRADMALYQAKHGGRDRVELWYKTKEKTE